MKVYAWSQDLVQALLGSLVGKSLLVVVVVTLVAAWPLGQLLWHHACRSKVEGKKLPPGSWGWPLVGESLPFLLSLTSKHVYYRNFPSNRFHKYGDVFKTHLFGTPYVVARGPEAVKLLTTSEDKLVEAHSLAILRKVLGEEIIINLVGERHRILRWALNEKFMGEGLRKFVGLVEGIAIDQMASYQPGDMLYIWEEAIRFTYNFIAGVTFSWGAGPKRDQSYELATQTALALSSLPINLPGFDFHRGMLARKRLNGMIAEEIELRRSGKVVADDLLTVMLNATHPDSNEPVLGGVALLDNVHLLVFAGHETSTCTLTWAVHLLSQNPKQLQYLVAEHEAIRSGKAAGEPLKWEDLSKMTFTTQVIQESLRISSLVFYYHRTVKQDFQLGGYDIPKGWNIMLDTHDLHHNPAFFPEAETFNPSRFQVSPKPNTYMPFGVGPRYCLGKDLAMMEMCVFLHHFILKCKWTALIKETTRELYPLPRPKGRVPIRIDAINTY